ncbi:MAG: hypothetical protein K6G33_13395 [Ruminococcus sp.]|uniref:SGNH/GDSL hydrolase family protein n=1 Tax=Ruminococcus sp. TaxID=41978 RepID=UPI0025F8DB65|nr:SGNH/GDSL hydrolase family protein [Ruminococcus sp.]MCR5601722.1 hypothetical protein [Ruminococcus sp.]
MRKVLSAVAAIAVMLAGTSFSDAGTSISAESTNGSIKIMAIGDSITDGYGISGSYRKYLYHELTQKGYSIDMVGSKSSSFTAEFTDSETGERFSYDDDNTGYSGYAIKEYPGRNGILETLKSTNCLSACKPDIVILQIGTNDVIDNYDMENSYARAQELIEYILENISDDSALFVTTIPDVEPNRTEVYNWFSNYRHSPDWQTNYPDDVAEEKILDTLHSYNTDLTALVQKMASENEKATLTGSKSPYLCSANVSKAITDVKSQLVDGVHPNNKGYKLMGEYWSCVIDSYLSGRLPEDRAYQTEDLEELQKFILGIPQNKLSSKSFKERYDLNNDDIVDIFDVVTLRKELIK